MAAHVLDLAAMRRGVMVAGAVAIAVAMGLVTAATARAADGDATARDVAIATPDGSADAVLAYPSAGRGPWPAVILWHDLAGLRPAYRDMARALASKGFVVLLPNAFYRSARATDGAVDMRDPEVRKRQTAYRAAATDDGIARDAVAYVAYLDTLEQAARGRKVGTVGYDVGGSYAFRTAAALPQRIAAVASIYGLGAATSRPNSPHLLVPTTTAAYFIVQSKDDDGREPEDKTEYTKVIAEGRLQGQVEVYPANHGFAVPGEPAYDAGASQRATDEILALFTARLMCACHAGSLPPRAVVPATAPQKLTPSATPARSRPACSPTLTRRCARRRL